MTETNNPIGNQCPIYFSYKKAISTMPRRRNIQEGEFVTICSKLSSRDKSKVKAIGERFGMNFYQIIQSLLLALVRYFDTDNLKTYNHDNMIDAFINVMFTTKGSFNPFKEKDRKRRRVRSAILFVEESPDLKPQLLFVRTSKAGNITETMNFDEMVNDFLCCIDPEGLKRVELMKNELGLFSTTHALHKLMMQYTSTTDEIKNDVEEMFADIRIPTGQAINEDIYYKRSRRINVDEYTTIIRNDTFRADL